MWKEIVMANLRYYTGICLQELREVIEEPQLG
jgi:hypothetical protein